MAFYLPSKNIKAFPLAKPRIENNTNDITSRIFYEQNVSNMIRQLIDVEGFIISGDVSTAGIVTEPVKINIYGYYFEIAKDTNLIDTSLTGNELYVYIEMQTPLDNNDNAPLEIVGADEISNAVYVYKGLRFGTSGELGSPNIHGFKLLEKYGNDWRLFQDSFAKFSGNSLKIDRIDGIGTR